MNGTQAFIPFFFMQKPSPTSLLQPLNSITNEKNHHPAKKNPQTRKTYYPKHRNSPRKGKGKKEKKSIGHLGKTCFSKRITSAGILVRVFLTPYSVHNRNSQYTTTPSTFYKNLEPTPNLPKPFQIPPLFPNTGPRFSRPFRNYPFQEKKEGLWKGKKKGKKKNFSSINKTTRVK